MLISMRKSATAEEVGKVVGLLESQGTRSQVVRERSRTVVVVQRRRTDVDNSLRLLPAVDSLIDVPHRFKLVSIHSRPQRTVVRVGDLEIGGETAVVIAGPCSVESREQLMTAARGVRDAGANLLRGGVYKPRTSPYEFQGLGLEGLKLLAEARELTGLPIVTEIVSTEDVDLVAAYADVLQVGARNMQNFALLRRLAKVDRPVLLKRNPAASVEEWLLAAEYLLAGGNDRVILCERGIKGSGTETRNTFDVSAVALARQLTHLPVMADPSHATGRRDLIPAVSRAALAAGADGLLLEVHPNPEEALSDGAQSLTIPEFTSLMARLAEPARKLLRTRLPIAVSHGRENRRGDSERAGTPTDRSPLGTPSEEPRMRAAGCAVLHATS